MTMEEELRFGRAFLLVFKTCHGILKDLIVYYYKKCAFSSFQAFLNSEKTKHGLFHCMYDECCCDFRDQCNFTSLRKWQWKLLYKKTFYGCHHGKNLRRQCPCMYTAVPEVTVDALNLKLCCLVVEIFQNGRKKIAIEEIRRIRYQLISSEESTLNEQSFDSICSKVDRIILMLTCDASSLYTDVKTAVQEAKYRLIDVGCLSTFHYLAGHLNWMDNFEKQVKVRYWSIMNPSEDDKAYQHSVSEFWKPLYYVTDNIELTRAEETSMVELGEDKEILYQREMNTGIFLDAQCPITEMETKNGGILWRSYQTEAFPHVEYLDRLITSFVKKHILFPSTKMHQERIVNIWILGNATKQNIRMVSKKKGVLCEMINEKDDANYRQSVPLPLILVYFMKEGEIADHCSENICKAKKQVAHLKSEIKVLIVSQNTEGKAGSLFGQQYFVVPSQKDEVRYAIAILIQETMFEILDKYEQDADGSSESPLNELRSIKSLKLHRKTKADNDIIKRRDVPDEAIKFLLGYDDFVACGIWSTDFRIFTKKSISNEDKDKICQQLKNVDESFYSSWKPSFHIITKEELYCPFGIQQGDQITEDGHKAGRKTSGTLGGFVIGSDELLYGLTCQHVITKTEADVYMNNDLNTCIGRCIFSSTSGTSTLCDFAVFQVHDRTITDCVRSLCDETDKERKASLCHLDVSDHHEKYIHKKGAITKWTSGKVACAKLHAKVACDRLHVEELMVFEGFEGGKFAEKGDSGSLVIAHDTTKNKNNLLVLGMVSGGEFESREDSSNKAASNVSRCSIGFSLQHAMKLFNDSFSDLSLNFDNEVKSSSSESDSE